MVVAALLLLILVAVVVLWIIGGTTMSEKFTFDAAGVQMEMNGLTTFLLGAAAALVALTALWMIMSGSKRGVRRRRERKELERRAEEAEVERQTALQQKDRADVEAAKGRVAARDAQREQETAHQPQDADSTWQVDQQRTADDTWQVDQQRTTDGTGRADQPRTADSTGENRGFFDRARDKVTGPDDTRN